ncbi:MAG: Rrf2 family transcriptional regulator [Verrucomicrobia bacterium]|nr:Rrf2 family transcriptional regulator [Verrucomicrobiota bacterium]MCF7708652.1 Rrf2 family transcriptional regulator [Verrucomicrobiota bacterium]
MHITRAVEYGIIGMLYLAGHDRGKVVMIDEISRKEDIPKSFLGKIFQSLTRAGLVNSNRGAGGGFYMARDSDQINILDIIEAVEGKIALQRCLDAATGCSNSDSCALCLLLHDIQETVKQTLANTTLADLAQKHADMKSHKHPQRPLTESVRLPDIRTE